MIICVWECTRPEIKIKGTTICQLLPLSFRISISVISEIRDSLRKLNIVFRTNNKNQNKLRKLIANRTEESFISVNFAQRGQKVKVGDKTIQLEVRRGLESC